MASVDICNSALVKMGLERISSLSDQNKRAILCNEQYDKLRKEVLYDHPWNFALKRADLAVTGTTPEFEYDNQFTLPADTLRVLNTHDPTIVWVVEGQLLLSSADEVEIRYIYDNEDTSTFTAKFNEVLAIRIAADLTLPLVGDRTLAKDFINWYDIWSRQGRSFDAQEGTPEDIGADEWLTARL